MRHHHIRVVSAVIIVMGGLAYLIIAQNNPDLAQTIALGYIALVLTIAAVANRWL